MTKVYTKINGKLTTFEVDTKDVNLAIHTVVNHAGIKPTGAVLALVTKESA